MKKITFRDFSKLKESGFSLIELLVSMAIVGVVSAAIYGIFFTSNRTYITQEEVADAQQRARIALDFMARDIRMAGLDPIGNAEDSVDGNGAGFKEAAANKIRFTADLDVNGGIDISNSITGRILNQERVSYELAGRELIRTLYEGTGDERQDVLINDVRELIFTYGDETEAVMPPPVTGSDLGRIRVVNISLTCEYRDAQGVVRTRNLSTTVTCRNPKG